MRRLGMTLVVVFALVGLVLVLAIRSGRQEPLDVVAAAKPRLGVSIESKRHESSSTTETQQLRSLRGVTGSPPMYCLPLVDDILTPHHVVPIVDRSQARVVGDDP